MGELGEKPGSASTFGAMQYGPDESIRNLDGGLCALSGLEHQQTRPRRFPRLEMIRKGEVWSAGGHVTSI
jgi:hypothetical protein